VLKWKAANLSGYKFCVDNVTGLMISSEYNILTTLSGILVIVIACVKPIAIKYAMIVNPFGTNSAKTT
jgi:hypothetical protein